jgi:hypothetical protein
VKHPEFESGQSVILSVDRAGVRSLMGRITPSFRQLYEDTVSKLQSGQGYKNSLLDLGHRAALELLLQEAWGPECAAMSNSNLLLLDVLNLTANVHNRKLIESLKRKISEQENEITELRKLIEAKGVTPES